MVLITKASGGVWISTKAYDTITDPTTDAALTTAKLDEFAGVIITTTTTWNSQTFGSPTVTTPWSSNVFTVINNDTSTNSFDVVDALKTITIQPWTAQKYVRDGTVWVTVEAVDASNITNIPSWTITATNVQGAINQTVTNDQIVDDNAFFYAIAFG